MPDSSEKSSALPQEISAWPNRGRVDHLPIPSRAIMKYAEMGGLFKPERAGLLKHCISSLIVAETIVRGVEQANALHPENAIEIDHDLVMEVIVAHCAVRDIAERAKKGQANEAENLFMQTHDDIDFATWSAINNNLPVQVIAGVEALQRSRGFPHKTVGPDNLYRPGTLDWSVAITQYASWLTSLSTVTTLDFRFNDLAKRHAGTEQTAKKLSAAEIEGYRQWAFTHLQPLAEHIGTSVEGFHGWLYEQLNDRHTVDTQNMLIQAHDLGLVENTQEFIPLAPSFLALVELIDRGAQPEATQHSARVLRAVAYHPHVFLEALAKQGGATRVSAQAYITHPHRQKR